jgi:hypothetical protein
MATISNRKTHQVITGEVPALIETMVKAQMKAAKMRAGNPRRYAEVLVRAAIRRNGHTDAEQRLDLSDGERAEWLAANPLED